MKLPIRCCWFRRLCTVALCANAVLFAGTMACRRRDPHAAPGPDRPVPAATFRIGLIAKSSSNPVFTAARLGAEARARELSAELGRPIEILWMTPPREDAAVQAARIVEAVNERVDALLISCSDDRKVTEAIDAAVVRGVPVMTFDSDAPTSKRFAFCGVDDRRAGEAVMGELARLMGDKGRFAVLAGSAQAPNLRRRVEGVKREAARHPGMRMAGIFSHVETPQAATVEMLRVARAHPDVTGWVLVGGWPLYTRTLLDDLDPQQHKIASLDALPPQLAYVEAGLAPVLLGQPTYLWGATGVETIVNKVLRGRDVPQTISMELVRVTKENLGTWARQLKQWGFTDVPEDYLR